MSNTDTRNYPFEIAPGGMQRIPVAGEKFIVRQTTGPVNVRWERGYLTNQVDGQGYNTGPVSWLSLTNDGAATITGIVLMADEDAIDNRIAGTVSVRNGATFVNSAPAVGIASAQLVAANAARTYLLMQNNHATSTVSINFSGAATMANGLLIRPGGYWESPVSVPIGAINAIADVANASFIVIEG